MRKHGLSSDEDGWCINLALIEEIQPHSFGDYVCRHKANPTC